MEVDPTNEKEMLNNFHNILVPEAKKHPGFISVKLMKVPASDAGRYNNDQVSFRTVLRKRGFAPEVDQNAGTQARVAHRREIFQVAKRLPGGVIR
jgi:hypothetical protein